jgi:putative flippase GtrA
VNRIRRLFDDERVRFLFVGGINTLFGYAVFVVLYLAAGHVIGYLGSLYLSYVIGVSLAFVLHRRVTFRAHETGGNAVLDFLRFASVYVVSLVINTIGLPLLVELGHLSALGAQAIMVIVTTVISYVGHKYFSFRRFSAPPRIGTRLNAVRRPRARRRQQTRSGHPRHP